MPVGLDDVRQAYEVVKANWPEVITGLAIAREVGKWGKQIIADHFRHAPRNVIATATENAADFAGRLEAKVRASIEAGVISEAQVEAALGDPSFVKGVQNAIIDSSESTSEFSHEQLAKLIYARLAAPPESSESVILRLAANKLKDLAPQHLTLLAMIYTVSEERIANSSELDLHALAEATSAALTPYAQLELQNRDLRHLESGGMLTVKPPESRGTFVSSHTDSYLLNDFSRHQSELHSGNVPAVYRRLLYFVQGDVARGILGTHAVTLNSIGMITGYSVATTLNGRAFEPTAVLKG